MPMVIGHEAAGIVVAVGVGVTTLDIGGMGKPVYDRLIEVGMNIVPFDGGSTDGVDIKSCANKRALGYFTLRDWFDSGFLCIDKNKHSEVIKQLEKIKFKYRSNGCKLIQAKVDMKKELKYSPDDADSLMMAVYAAVTHLGSSTNTASAGTDNKPNRVSKSTRGRAPIKGKRK